MSRMADETKKGEPGVRVEDHLGLVRSVVLKYDRKSRLEDSDLYSVGCLALMEAAGSFDPSRASFPTWATRIIRHRVVDEIRRTARVKETASADMLSEIASPEKNSPVHLAESMLARRKSDSREEARDKRLLRVYFLEEKTLSEIGRELGMSKEGARKRINSALSEIRRKNRSLLENFT